MNNYTVNSLISKQRKVVVVGSSETSTIRFNQRHRQRAALGKELGEKKLFRSFSAFLCPSRRRLDASTRLLHTRAADVDRITTKVQQSPHRISDQPQKPFSLQTSSRMSQEVRRSGGQGPLQQLHHSLPVVSAGLLQGRAPPPGGQRDQHPHKQDRCRLLPVCQQVCLTCP